MKEVKRLRRVVAIALVMLILGALLGGCRPLVSDEGQPISVYATFYPMYVLTDAVMRDVPDASLHCLVQPQDGCLRAYQLSDWDASLLASGADAVIAGGRGLESFESTLFGWGDAGPAISAVLYNLELYNQQDSVGSDGEAQSHLRGPNPHLYMSIEGAGQIIESISAMMVSLDPDYAGLYVENQSAAIARLEALLASTREELSAFRGEKVALMNEALIYVANDYGFEVAEWIDRESGTSLIGPELDACLERLSASGARVVLIERQAPQALMEALEAAGYGVAPVDILSTHVEGEGFDRYIEIQSANAQAIREAFERADGGKESH